MLRGTRTLALGLALLALLTIGIATPAAQAQTQPRPIPKGYIHASDASGICLNDETKTWKITYWVRKVQTPDVYPLRRIQIDSDCPFALPFGFFNNDQPGVRFLADAPLHTTLAEATLAGKGWLNYNVQGTWTGGGVTRPLRDPYWRTYNADWVVHKNGTLTRHRIH